MSALANFLSSLDTYHQEVLNMVSCDYFYLNGKRIEITFHDMKPPNPIPLSFIREHIKDIIPEDSVFLDDNGEIIPKENEDKIFSVDGDITKVIHIFSEKLYSERNLEEKNIILDYKIIEEKEEFNIYEYPNNEIKEDEEYYSIVLLGDINENEKFVNGFLNYLYDIKKDNKYRLKIQKLEKEDPKKGVIFQEIYKIKHEKGNFMFYCLNFGPENEIGASEVLEMNNIFHFTKVDDVHINLIVINKINSRYEDRIDNKIFQNALDKIGRKLAERKPNKENTALFFVGPNIFLSNILFNLRLWTVDYYGYHRPDNSYDKSRLDLKKYENTLIYCYNYLDIIYETKNTKYEYCLYEQAMESFEKFYKALTNAPKNNQFKSLRKNFAEIFLMFTPLAKKYSEFKLKKAELNNMDKRKEYFQANIEQLTRVKEELEILKSRKNDIKGFIEQHEKRIKENPKIFIPLTIKNNKVFVRSKTNVCYICRYNCHPKCNDLIKNFCKCFDFKFNCKNCPNKCGASCHVISTSEMKPYEYKTFDELYPSSIGTIDERIQYALKNTESESKEIHEKICSIEMDLRCMNEVTDKSKIDMKKINDELNNEIEKYNHQFVFGSNYEGTFEDEIFRLFIYSFFKIEYNYEFTKD